MGSAHETRSRQTTSYLHASLPRSPDHAVHTGQHKVEELPIAPPCSRGRRSVRILFTRSRLPHRRSGLGRYRAARGGRGGDSGWQKGEDLRGGERAISDFDAFNTQRSRRKGEGLRGGERAISDIDSFNTQCNGESEAGEQGSLNVSSRSTHACRCAHARPI